MKGLDVSRRVRIDVCICADAAAASFGPSPAMAMTGGGHSQPDFVTPRRLQPAKRGDSGEERAEDERGADDDEYGRDKQGLPSFDRPGNDLAASE